MNYDKIILGAGIYGLYSALYSAKKGEKVIVLEYDNDSFSRASYINQARVHNGYHYPRSISTALKSSNYFNRFTKDFSFAINSKFRKIYAISSDYSWTSASQFEIFCKNANIKCERLHPDRYFKHGKCDGVFETEEYAFGADKLKKYF
jgi:glycine/D-amino acid oxidase-like deaminating enzyme